MCAIATCVIPNIWKDVALGGNGCSAILLDLDYKFSLLRLVSCLEGVISSRSGGILVGSECAGLVRECLDRVYIIRSPSLESIGDMFESLSGLIDSDNNIRLVAIDSLTAIHHIDAAAQSEAAGLKLATRQLKKLVQDFDNLTILCTKGVLYPKSTLDYLDREWHQFVVSRYATQLMHRNDVPGELPRQVVSLTAVTSSLPRSTCTLEIGEKGIMFL